MKYDVFISYRRTSYETANLIATRLKSKGYRVFFDLESMRSGLFNEQLYSVIEECKDFVLVLPPDALDRCMDEEDWLRKEILHAMKFKKNIIPVMLNGFQWPQTLPDGMESLSMYQALTASSIEYFDLSMQRLEKYLKSKKNSRFRRIVRWTLGVLCALVILYGVAELCLRKAATPACTVLVDYMTAQVGAVELIMDSNDKVLDACDKLDYSDPQDVLDLLSFHETELTKVRDMFRDGSKVIPESYMDMLFLYNVTPKDIWEFDEYVKSLADELQNSIGLLRELIQAGVVRPSSKRMVSINLETNRHLANILYFSYLEVLTRLPDKSLDSYNRTAGKFMYMPHTGLGLKTIEYARMIEREDNEVERLLDIQEALSIQGEDQLADAQRTLDSLDSAIRNLYQETLLQHTIVDSFSIDENWGHITTISTFLDDAYQYATDPEMEGNEYAVTSMQVYGDLNAMLSQFSILYPSFVDVAEGARHYYREVAELKRPLAGAIVIGGSVGQSEMRAGDVIIKVGSVNIQTPEDITAALADNKNGKVRYLRLIDGAMEECSCAIVPAMQNLLYVPLK